MHAEAAGIGEDLRHALIAETAPFVVVSDRAIAQLWVASSRDDKRLRARHLPGRGVGE